MIRILASTPIAITLLALAACGGGGGESADAPANVATGPAQNTAEPTAEDFASLTGDAANGERLFAQCAICHTVEAGQNRLGPSLHAVIGRPAGSVEGFSYSEAMRGSGIGWSEQELFEYLRDPQGKVPGTTMVFAGLATPQDRADIIAHLAAQR